MEGIHLQVAVHQPSKCMQCACVLVCSVRGVTSMRQTSLRSQLCYLALTQCTYLPMPLCLTQLATCIDVISAPTMSVRQPSRISYLWVKSVIHSLAWQNASVDVAFGAYQPMHETFRLPSCCFTSFLTLGPPNSAGYVVLHDPHLS